MNISNTVLRNLSSKINNGYPVTAMAIANNYMDKKCPLRKALALKVRQKLNLTTDDNLQKILEGDKLSDIDLEQTIHLYDRKVHAFKKETPLITKRTPAKRRLPCRRSLLSKSLKKKYSETDRKPLLIRKR